MSMRIGYVGLGIMGAAMASNLLKAGYHLKVWNRSRDKMEPLIEQGAVAGASPADVASSVEIICINVTDTPDVEEVIFGDAGIVQEIRSLEDSSLIIVDHSTISPQATREMAARLKPQNISLLDAPVSGGDIGAKNGTLSIMVGGSEAAFGKVRPMLEAVGKSITYMGPSGSGQATKACNQILCALNLLGTCEAMALAVKEGLDLKKMIEVTSAGAGGSWSLANLGPQIAENDMNPGFMIDLLNKDLGIVQQESEALKLPLEGTHLVTALLQIAASQGFGGNGTQALSKVIESKGGFQYCTE